DAAATRPAPPLRIDSVEKTDIRAGPNVARTGVTVCLDEARQQDRVRIVFVQDRTWIGHEFGHAADCSETVTLDGGGFCCRTAAVHRADETGRIDGDVVHKDPFGWGSEHQRVLRGGWL